MEQSELGLQLKEEGMKKAADGRPFLLEVARDTAWMIAIERGEVTSDDVAEMMEDNGYFWSDLGNARGSVFVGKEWKFTGRYKKSTRPSAHARDIKIWELN